MKKEFSFFLGIYSYMLDVVEYLPHYQKKIVKRHFGYILIVIWVISSRLKEVPKHWMIK